jgi:hypothetical protein
MRSLDELLAECDLHFMALQEAMARCPSPLAVEHLTTRNPESDKP